MTINKKYVNLEVGIYCIFPNGDKSHAFNGDFDDLTTSMDSNRVYFNNQEDLDIELELISSKFFTNIITTEDLLNNSLYVERDINPKIFATSEMRAIIDEAVTYFDGQYIESQLIWKASAWLVDSEFNHMSADDLAELL